MKAGVVSHEPPRRRQFSVRGLFSFMFATSIYLSAFVPLKDAMLSIRYDDSPAPWRIVASILVGWTVFVVIYKRWRLREALSIHYSGPLIVAVLAVPAGLVNLCSSPTMNALAASELLTGLLIALTFGCGVALAVSFPASIVMLIYLGLRPC